MKVIRGSQIEFVPASHEDQERPGVLKRVLASSKDLAQGQVQMLNWSWLRAGHSFRSHYHEDMQEVFVILSGQLRARVGQEETQLGRGDAIIIEAREVHQMWNPTEQDCEYLVFGVSGGVGGKTVLVD